MNFKKVTLGDYTVDVSYGLSLPSTGTKGKNRFLRITDIQNNSVDWESVPFCIPNEKKDISKALLKNGDIVFARTGATTGKSFVIQNCPKDAVFASYLIRVRLNTQIDPIFIHYYFQTPHYWSQITTNSVGSTTVGVNSTKLKDLQIPLPPLPIQKNIVQVLDKAQQLIDLREKQIQLFDELVQSIFYEMFGDPVTNPKGWAILCFGDHLNAIDSGWSPKCLTNPAPSNSWGVLKLSAVTGGIYKSYENKELPINIKPKEKIEVKKGDLLFTRKNTAELVGSCAYIFDTPSKLMIPDLIFRFNLKSSLESLYIWGLFNSKTFKSNITTLAGGSAASMINISKSKLEKLEIPVPPIKLQNEFAEKVQKIEAQKVLMQQSLVEMKNNYNSLMQRAFRGDLFEESP